MNHYTYELTCKNMKYIGVRSCECLPNEDTDYWGSSKYNPKDLREVGVKEVLAEFSTRLEAAQHEIDLHSLYDVGANPEYWNRSKQTSTGFDTTGTTMSDETKSKLAAANTGKTFSDEHRAKISAAQTGKTFSNEHRANMSAAKTGDKHPRFKLANIYCRYTNNLIAEAVGVKDWCKSNGYDYSCLGKTAHADKSIPSTTTNRHYHKGIYAQYV